MAIAVEPQLVTEFDVVREYLSSWPPPARLPVLAERHGIPLRRLLEVLRVYWGPELDAAPLVMPERWR